MSVWLCIPSKRPPEEVDRVLNKWRERGYRIAIQRDCEPGCENGGEGDGNNGITWLRPYRGYADAVNYLARAILTLDSGCDWIVCAGDDTLPDPNKSADEIAEECSEHFLGDGWVKHWVVGISEDGLIAKLFSAETTRARSTFGVMQPTGDDWSDKQGRIIDRVAGSPWLGREWCLRANQGKGPLWPNFFHMFADETLQCVAQKLGVFWQRSDLTHLHSHWGRPRTGERIGQADRMPEFLKQANSGEEWNKSKAEFERLKAGGFAECMPL